MSDINEPDVDETDNYKPYQPKVGDLVCLMEITWHYCGYGVVLAVGEDRMVEVYWYDLETSYFEYAEDLMLYEENIKKCHEMIRFRRMMLESFGC